MTRGSRINKCDICFESKSSRPSHRILNKLQKKASEPLTFAAKAGIDFLVVRRIGIIVLWSVEPVLGQVHVDAVIARFGYKEFVVLQRLRSARQTRFGG